MESANEISSVNDRLWWFLTRINALVVMDGYPGSGHYASFGPGDMSTDPSSGDQYFGLSEFIATLTAGGPLLAKFSVTKAHRDTDVGGAADIENFRFDQHDLSVYDEIWLFGVGAPNETHATMTDSELAALTTFMNGGGGVFATGDHEDLGVALNGRVPRVRSMRQWYFPSPGPLGEPVAPTAIGTERMETTQPSAGAMIGTVSFDNQSDDIPQPIRPRMYTWRSEILGVFAYPHPLLCGPNGIIRVLPDHMHEGQVIVPWDPNATLTFGGHSIVEYPLDPQGNPVLPEIIAWGTVLPETDVASENTHVGDPNDVAERRDFGVIGAYDGQRVGVGRVAVDSTWHHFFNINLIGDPVAQSPKNMGFTASTSGKAVLADIQAYYRNIGMWIARPGTHRRLFAAAVWYALRAQPLNMLVSTRRKYDHADIMRIGSLALTSIYRISPPCTIIYIVWPIFVDGPGPVIPPDPWAIPQPGDPVFFDPTRVLQAALGQAVVTLSQKRLSIRELESEKAVDEIAHAVVEGARMGLRALGVDIGRYAEGLLKMAKGLTGEGRN